MRILSAAFVLLLAACASVPRSHLLERKMVYNCTEKLSSPLGEFVADHWGFSWVMNTDEGHHAQATYRVNLDPTDGGMQRLFPGFAARPDPVADPSFEVAFYNQFTSPDWFGKYRKRVVEIHFGDRLIRENVSDWAAVWLGRADVQALFAGADDVTATLRDEKGAVLDMFTLTHAQLAVIDQTLRDLQVRVLANVADQPTRCRLEPEPLVVVT